MIEFILLRSRHRRWGLCEINKFLGDYEYIPIIKENDGEGFKYVFLRDIYKKVLSYSLVNTIYGLYGDNGGWYNGSTSPVRLIDHYKSDDEFLNALNPLNRDIIELVYRYEIRKRK